MERMLALYATIRSLKAGGRLRVATSMEFAACALAVRVAVTRHHHGHHKFDIAPIDTSAARLLLRLETVRKRAKRAEIRQLGADRRSSSQQTLGEYFRNLVARPSSRLRVHAETRRIPSKLLSQRPCHPSLLNGPAAELIDRKHKVPAEHELRRLVRLCLRVN